MTETFAELALPCFRVGHAEDPRGKTGCTVFLFDERVPAGLCLCGPATSTRQADSLRPEHMGRAVDAICFTGGSAFGLDAAGGVLSFLEKHGRGLPTRYGVVPVCPTAALFDLGVGDSKARPDAEMARKACENARDDGALLGSVGAGRGASVGKFHGVAQAMKGGFGAADASVSLPTGEIRLQAFAAVNAFGDILDENGDILAGTRKSPDSLEFLNTVQAIAGGGWPSGFIPPDSQNTVLMLLLTDAYLEKEGCNALAEAAVEGLRRAVSPALSPFDGDLIFCASLGQKPARPEELYAAAGDVLAEAIRNGVRTTAGEPGLPSAADIGKKRSP